MQNLKQLLAPKQSKDPEAAPAIAPAPSQDDLVSALLDIKRLYSVRAQHAQLLSNHQGTLARVQEAEENLQRIVLAKHANIKSVWQDKLKLAQDQEKAAHIALFELEASSDWKTLKFLQALKALLADL